MTFIKFGCCLFIILHGLGFMTLKVFSLELENAGCSSEMFYLNQYKVLIQNASDLPEIKVVLKEHGFSYKLLIVSNYHLFARIGDIQESHCPSKRNWTTEIQDNRIKSIEQVFQRKRSQVYTYGSNDGLRTTSTTSAPRQGSYLTDKKCPVTDTKWSVTVAVVDIGFDLEHPNLIDRINLSLSYNFLTEDHRPTPPPSHESLYSKDYPYFMRCSHGTMCMGIICSTCLTDTSCNQGVSDHVQLAGLKILSVDRMPDDVTEARALIHRLDEIDIVSASYGSTDNRGFMEIGNVLTEALQKGVEQGRDCKGRIYIYPSGNGHMENCNMDGYAKSVYTLTITNVDMDLQVPDNIEQCPCTIAAAQVDRYFVAPALHGLCIDGFKGSSAAVPVAAGHIANMLRVNPLLTKRDVEHIIVKTASTIGFSRRLQWKRNGFGLKYNDRVGFGLLFPDHMQMEAKTWRPVSPQIVWESESVHNALVINSNSTCDIHHLEYVEVLVDICCYNCTYEDTGKFDIYLLSAMGTRSSLFTTSVITRYGDPSDDKRETRCKPRKFSTVQFWGENPFGRWLLKWTSTDSVPFDLRTRLFIFYGTGISTTATNWSHHTCEKGSPPNGNVFEETKGDSNHGHVVLVVIICPVIICLLFGLLWCVYKRKKRECPNTRKGISCLKGHRYARSSSEDEDL